MKSIKFIKSVKSIKFGVESILRFLTLKTL